MNKDLKVLCILIGSIIIACILIGLPVLCGIAYGLGWATEIKAVLTFIVVGELSILAACIAGTAND